MSDLLLMRGGGLRSLLSTPGLVACYLPYLDAVGRNVTVGFGSWVHYKTNATPSQTDPLGSTDAFMVTDSDTENVGISSKDITSSGSLIGSMYIKNVDSPKTDFFLACNSGSWFGSWVTITWDGSSIASASWQSYGGYTPYEGTIEDVGDGWYKVTSTVVTLDSGSAPFRLAIQPAAAPPSNVGSVYVWRPQLNLGTTLYPYSAPVGLSQSVVDRSGHGNHARLGSTSGADTNDPSWGDAWLLHGSDDYVDGGMLPIPRESSWSIVFAFRPSGGGAGEFGTLLNFSNRAADNEHCRIAYNSTASLLRVNIRRSTSENEYSAPIVGISDTSKWYIGVLERKSYATGGTLKYIQPSDGATLATVTADDEFSGGNGGLSIGCMIRANIGSNVNSMYLGGCIVYNRVLTASEINRQYNALKTLLAGQGVTVE